MSIDDAIFGTSKSIDDKVNSEKTLFLKWLVDNHPIKMIDDLTKLGYDEKNIPKTIKPYQDFYYSIAETYVSKFKLNYKLEMVRKKHEEGVFAK